MRNHARVHLKRPEPCVEARLVSWREQEVSSSATTTATQDISDALRENVGEASASFELLAFGFAEVGGATRRDASDGRRSLHRKTDANVVDRQAAHGQLTCADGRGRLHTPTQVHLPQEVGAIYGDEAAVGREGGGIILHRQGANGPLEVLGDGGTSLEPQSRGKINTVYFCLKGKKMFIKCFFSQG